MLREEQRPQKRLLQKSGQINRAGSSKVSVLSVRPLVELNLTHQAARIRNLLFSDFGSNFTSLTPFYTPMPTCKFYICGLKFTELFGFYSVKFYSAD